MYEETRDGNGNTELSHAANKVDLPKIRDLIKKGANVNAGCYNLCYNYENNRSLFLRVSTPLMNVIANCVNYNDDVKNVIKLMLEKGADVNSFDSDGQTVIDICFKKKEWEKILDVILEHTKNKNINIERKKYDIVDVGDKLIIYLYENNLILYDENMFKYFVSLPAVFNHSISLQKKSHESPLTDDRIKLFDKMLEYGIDEFNKKNNTEKAKDDIIVCAAILGKHNAVKELINKGANVNVKFYYENTSFNSMNYNSLTALMCAAKNGNFDIVNLLLNNAVGIDVDLKADNGLNALSYAIMSQNTKVVEEIGKKVKHPNGNELMTFVQTYVYYFNSLTPKLVNTILNINGVNVNFKNSKGETALMFLISDCEPNEEVKNVAKTIINCQTVDLNLKNTSGKNALMLLIERSSEKQQKLGHYNDIILDILNNKKCDLNLKDTSGKTALFYAVIHNNLGITTSILKKRNVNELLSALDEDKKTALFYANNPKIAELLLSTKKNKNVDFVNKLDKDGKTALFYVPYNVIEFLKGADVNLKDNVGKTALFYKKNAEEVKELLNLGADVTLKDNKGNTIVMEIINKLNDHDPNRSYKLLEILMEILNKKSKLRLSFKNKEGYNVITFLFLISLDTKMINQVLNYCHLNLHANEDLFKNEDEVEYYINYMKNEKKEDDINNKDFESILNLLNHFKIHTNVRPGGKGAKEALERLNEKESSKKQKTTHFGTMQSTALTGTNFVCDRRDASLRRRSYVAKTKRQTPRRNLQRKRSMTGQTIRRCRKQIVV